MNKHGNITSSWDGDIFIVELKEAFNEDGLEFWFTQLKQIIESKKLTSWRRLEIWDEEVLGSPETIKIGKAIYDWYEEHGCEHTAVVVENGIQKQIIQHMLNSNAQVFRDKEKALNWLKSR